MIREFKEETMDKKGMGRKLTPRAFLCMCILAAASAAMVACSTPTTLPATPPPTTIPATVASQTALPATATPPPTLAPTATPTVVFNGQARVDVSAMPGGALDALTNVHPDRADPVVLAEQINALAQFSVDTTFTVEPDGFGRAALVYAGDGDVIIKLAGQDEEITDGSVRFFPQKNGAMIPARQQRNGGETGLDILDAANDRVMAYRKVEENGAVDYEITAEVNEAGQWVEYAGEQVKRYTEAETIFAEPVVEAEPLYWRLAMSKVIEGYQVKDSKRILHTVAGYDVEHPVIDIVSSNGIKIKTYGQIGYFGNERPRLVSRTGDNTEMADNVVTWLSLVQKEYNKTLGSSEGHTEAFMTVIDERQLVQLTGDEQGPISPDRVLDGGVRLMREVPVAIEDLSQIILLKGSFPEIGTVADYNRYVPVTLNNGKVVYVYNMVTYQVNNWGITRVAFVYPDSENPGKSVLLQYRISCYELSIGGSVFHRCAS